MDVHPPLAKLLLTLAGWLAGFDGEFDFKDIGKDYVEPGVPYVAMRLLPALMGVMTVPTIFLTLKATGCRTMTAAMGAGLVIFGRIFTENLLPQINQMRRERSADSIPFDSSGLALDHFHRVHCPGLHVLHKPA